MVENLQNLQISQENNTHKRSSSEDTLGSIFKAAHNYTQDHNSSDSLESQK